MGESLPLHCEDAPLALSRQGSVRHNCRWAQRRAGDRRGDPKIRETSGRGERQETAEGRARRGLEGLEHPETHAALLDVQERHLDTVAIGHGTSRNK